MPRCYKNPEENTQKEEVELDEGYLELDFKDEFRTADVKKAYNYINNKIWASG